MTSNVIPRSGAEHGKPPTADDEPGSAGGPRHTTARLSTPADVEAHLPSLRALLQSCVNSSPSTSSIGFLAPLSDADADRYWRTLGTTSLASGTCYLFASLLTGLIDDGSTGDEEVAATVQLFMMPKATHARRGEVAKLIVRPSCRRSGLGRAMMEDVEALARDVLGLRMLTLDTETETPARAFYGRIGWTEWCTCPDYATFADARLGSATFFVKA